MNCLRQGVLWALPLILLVPAGARADDLADRLEKVTRGPAYKHARWGILVVDAGTGKTVYEQNADQLFAPASVTKVYSCAAALVGLGAEHRFETPVYQRGKVDKGVLDGDLILRAQGDPTLGGRTTADGKMAFTDDDHIYASSTSTTTALTDTDPLAGLKQLARQVKAAGIRQVSGDVFVDDRLFERARGSGSGPRLLSPVMVNDNVVDVTVKPGAEVGDQATWELRPATEYVQVDVRVTTAAKKVPAVVRVDQVAPQKFVVRGVVPVGHKPVVRICVVDDPVGFARALFIDALRREGVEVKASALRPPQGDLPELASYNKLERVALLKSAPLSEALKVTLKVSHNLYASTLPLLLAVKEGKRTLSEGMRAQGKILADLGVDVQSISLESGAGGGDGDRVSPRATVGLLAALMKRPDFAAFKEALPVLGVDGTLARVVGKNSPAKGKVYGKTGTYTDADLLNLRSHLRSKSLAGVMTTAKGRTLVYAIFVNDVSLPQGTGAVREGKTIGQLCEILYEHAP